jgi:protein TonB
VDFAQQQRSPSKYAVGFAIVIVMHILLGWALVSGLARKVVEVIKAPIETKIIEEVKPPPPPPENLPPPPKFAPPPPSFVPPPEVVIAPPPTPAPTITTTQIVPPPAPPVVIAPPAPPVEVAVAPAPGPSARPAVIDVNTCSKPVYPTAAAKAEATGSTRIRFTVDGAGKVVKAEIEKPSGRSREHRMLDQTAVEALSQCSFKPGLDEQGKPVGSASVVTYDWTLK